MDYRVGQPSESSEDSDSMVGPCYKRKRESADTSLSQDEEMRNVTPPRKLRNFIWRNVLQERELDEALSNSYMLEGLDRTRGAESYYFHEQPDNLNTNPTVASPAHSFDDHDLRLKISKGRHRVKTIIISNEYDPTLSRTHIPATFDSSSDIVKSVIVNYLGERNIEIIERIVDLIGVKLSMEFLYLAEDVQNAGGLYFSNGTHRRSPGGVFLHLIKNSSRIEDDVKKNIFMQCKQEKKAKKRKRKKLKRANRNQGKAFCDDPIPTNTTLLSHNENDLTSRTTDSTCLPLTTVQLPEDGEVFSMEEDDE